MKIKNFMPDEYVAHVHELDYRNLRKDGFDTIIFDLDNTLAPYSVLSPTKELKFFVSFLKDLGYRVFIMSNSKMPRVAPFLDELDIFGVGPSYKPFSVGIKKLPNINPKETIFCGDQLVTDIWMSKRNQFYSVLVHPIEQKQDKWITKVNRRFEAMILRKIKEQEPEYYEMVLKARYE